MLDAGVDIDAGNALVDRIKPAAKRTNRPGVMAGWVVLARCLILRMRGMSDPILVGATDGVGTKLRIAIDTGEVDGVGIDLGGHVRQRSGLSGGGAALSSSTISPPASLRPRPPRASSKALPRAVSRSGCALIGGETAEMPGMYPAGDFDLAGFAVGAMERGTALPADVAEGRRAAWSGQRWHPFQWLQPCAQDRRAFGSGLG